MDLITVGDAGGALLVARLRVDGGGSRVEVEFLVAMIEAFVAEIELLIVELDGLTEVLRPLELPRALHWSSLRCL